MASVCTLDNMDMVNLLTRKVTFSSLPTVSPQKNTGTRRHNSAKQIAHSSHPGSRSIQDLHIVIPSCTPTFTPLCSYHVCSLSHHASVKGVSVPYDLLRQN
ncbi:hypothetical protein DPMN_109850 [Dreissena polymorpha]|uniref:Uncharacterized protein n=1 Tax=Dreissena polymorpha TaxID=45954 RepID=A0A9D4KB03_DREPO|nr:hypothetical protein DPMN_109850 [Dreissena polymorpha]